MTSAPDIIAAARKKLRQAEFFLNHAIEISARPRLSRGEDRAEPIGFYISACLTAAQSVYYVLFDKNSGRKQMFGALEESWRAGLPGERRTLFGRMIGVRDNDVHRAEQIGTQLPKWVPAPPSYLTASPYYRRPRGHPSFGPPVETEEQNPDGSKVVGEELRGTIGFYIEHQGRRMDALDACRTFIDLLTALVEAVDVSTHP